jgi:hypothetical protein
MDYEQRSGERVEELAERGQRAEPLVDTVVLDTLDDLDLPLRGEMRQRVLKRVKTQVRQRRTVDGIAARMSNTLVQPVSTAIEQELDNVVRSRIQERLEKQAERRGKRK